MAKLLRSTASTKTPLNHLAIIMDGNGRWAKLRNLARIKGHAEGAKRVIEIARASQKLGIRYLSLFAFSTENWNRSKQEIQGLFLLLNQFLKQELPTMHQFKIRLIISGDMQAIPRASQRVLEDALKQTEHYTDYYLNFCINYGGQHEVIQATKRIVDAITKNEFNLQDLNVKSFNQFLDTHLMPPVDCVIRTSGELRLSNFLLYQSAYAELIFVKDYWPDFTEKVLIKTLKLYQKRQRRFGHAHE
jgi:undecaprenyl diphosphate synthase